MRRLARHELTEEGFAKFLGHEERLSAMVAHSEQFESGEVYWPKLRIVWHSTENFMSFFEGDTELRDEVLRALFHRFPEKRHLFMRLFRLEWGVRVG